MKRSKRGATAGLTQEELNRDLRVIKRKLPRRPAYDCEDIKAYEARFRVHSFTDIALIPDPARSDGVGNIAIGGILVNPWGQKLYTWRGFRGYGTSNDAEFQAILWGVECAARAAPYYRNSVIVCHSDSEYAYNALTKGWVNKDEHVRLVDRIHREVRQFKAHLFQWRPASNYGIRNAETQAQKSLRDVFEEPRTWRGSKGTRWKHEPQWNPFDGEEASWCWGGDEE